MHSTPSKEYLDALIAICREAGTVIMGYYHGGYETQHKLDKSPVTDADIAANALIIQQLQALDPNIPIIAEEDEVRLEATSQFWLVDPLDGTRAFVAGEPEFTVNIGLIQNASPVLGVIYAPAQQLMYYGQIGVGAFRAQGPGAAQPIQVRPKPAGGLTVVRSKSHPSKTTEAFLQTLEIKELISGSSSIKFCQVAEGSADIYPRFGRTMEWDTAAGHAILNAAGGFVETASGEPLLYGKNGFENPHFIAYGDIQSKVSS